MKIFKKMTIFSLLIINFVAKANSSTPDGVVDELGLITHKVFMENYEKILEEIKKYFSEKDNVNKYVEEFVKGLKGADPSDRIQISKMIRQASSSMKNEDIQSELFNLIQRIILDKVLQDAKQVPLPSKIKIISNGPNQSQKDLNTQTKSTSKDEASINKTQANGPENEDSIHKTQEGISEDDVSVHSAQASDSGSNFSEDYTDKNMRSTYFKQNKEPTSENEANNS